MLPLGSLAVARDTQTPPLKLFNIIKAKRGESFPVKDSDMEFTFRELSSQACSLSSRTRSEVNFI